MRHRRQLKPSLRPSEICVMDGHCERSGNVGVSAPTAPVHQRVNLLPASTRLKSAHVLLPHERVVQRLSPQFTSIQQKKRPQACFDGYIRASLTAQSRKDLPRISRITRKKFVE